MADKKAFLLMIALCFFSHVFYFWFVEGLIASISLFAAVFGMGAYVNILYLVIENRVPP